MATDLEGVKKATVLGGTDDLGGHQVVGSTRLLQVRDYTIC